MTNRSNELETFKSSVNLTEFAASRGYALDRKASSSNSAVMRGSNGDKIIVAKGTDGHFVYFSVGEPADSGSIIDFIQKRGGGSLGEVRKLLRPWIGASASPSPSRPARSAYISDLKPIERDTVAVRARFEEMRALEHGRHPYLTGTRSIPEDLLADPRFASRIRMDARGNAVFGHVNREGLCGFELKNAGFTGFSKGGTKGLWASGVRGDDRKLVIAESAIDALSYAALFGHEGTRFVSLAGQVSPEQVELMRAAMEKLPAGEVVLAVDNDEGGSGLAAKFTGVFEAVGREELSLRIDRPEAAGTDWNDMLRKRSLSPPPPAPGLE